MKNLKKLNLSHTKSNRAVIQTLTANCKKLENLNLENCKLIYDECIEDICNGLSQTIQYLNIDNIKLYTETLIKVLNTCVNLKFLYASELIDVISNLYNSIDLFDENRNEKSPKTNIKYNFDTFYIDSDVILKEDKMQALSYFCPNLKLLRLNCISSNDSLAYLDGFSNLTELIIANNSSLISFKFNGHLLETLKGSLGRRLKNLNLIYFLDVNLRSIAKYCPNLQSLNVEFTGYYEPAIDRSLNEKECLFIRPLRALSIGNISTKFEHVHLNIGQFKKDLTMLLGNGLVKSLQLAGLNELDDEYFTSLYSTPVNRTNPNSGYKYLLESLESLDLKQMGGISAKFIKDYLVNNSQNNLKELNLIECKQIGKSDFIKMNKLVSAQNLDCKIKWT